MVTLGRTTAIAILAAEVRQPPPSASFAVPGLESVDAAHAVVHAGDLILAWSNDSLRVIRVSRHGVIRRLVTARLEGPLRATRVMQLTAHHDSVYIVISDRRTEFVVAADGEVVRREIDFPIVPELQLTYSAIGVTPQRSIIRIPILLPELNGEAKAPVLLTRSSGQMSLDTTALAGRVVSVQMRDGSSLLYDSPLRALHDVGTRHAIAGDGSSFVSVDARNRGTVTELDVRVVSLDSTILSRRRWSVLLPLLTITTDEWRQARDSSVRLLASQFVSAEAASDALGALARPGDMLPSVRAVRASPAGALVELQARYAARAKRDRMVFISELGDCSIPAAAAEQILAVGSQEIWTLEAKGGRTYARSRPLCEPQR